MKLSLIDSATNKLCLDSVDDRVDVYYFSIFDSSTFESDEVSLSFKAEAMFSELNRFVQTGEMHLCEDRQSFSIKSCGEYWRIDLNSQNQSHSILNVDIDMKSIVDFINSK